MSRGDHRPAHDELGIAAYRLGLGRITFPDGKSLNDRAHGIGECRGSDGKIGKCEFVNGEFSGWQ